MAIYTSLKWQYFSIPGLIFYFIVSLTFAQTPQEYITKIHSFSVPFPVEAITMSGDEALIAVSMRTPDSNSQVQIFDRQSQKPLVQILSPGRQIQQIIFDHYTRRLALIDSEHIQLWDLEEFPIQPDHPLSSSYLIDEIQHHLNPGTEIKFSKQSSALIWGEKNQIQQHYYSLQPSQVSTLWTEEQSTPLQSFAFDNHGEWIAYSLANDKRIFLVNPNQKQTKPYLDYHHFPVIKIKFTTSETVLSLDTERNLVWGQMNTRVKTHGIFLKNLSSEEVTKDVYTIYQDHFLAILAQNSTNTAIHAYIMDKNGTQLDKIPLVSLKSFSTSPTGAYLLAASSPSQVDIYQLKPHQDPVDYIQHLQTKGATEMARRYRNHLETLPSQLSENDLSSLTLKNLVDNLNAALQAKHWAEVNQWVRKILELDPQNSDALHAKQLLNEHQDFIILEQGKEEIQKDNLQQAIRILTQISKTSPHRLEARQLIAETENQIQLQNAFEKAKQEVLLENWAKAKALLLPVLTKEPNHQGAQTLLSEIEAQEKVSQIVDYIAVLVLLVFLGGIGFIAIKKRKQVLEWLSLSEKEAAPLNPPMGRTQINPLSDNSPEKQTYLETLKKAQTVLELSRKADRSGKYTARFIDFEAEIAILRKKAGLPDAPYNHLSNQLLHIMQTVRGFNFEAKQKQSTANTQSNSQESQPPPSQSPPPPKTQTYYQILNISPKATLPEIKRAYHEQIKAYHPDLHQNSNFEWVKKEAEAKTRLIQKAYDTLKNQKSRQHYDKSINSK